MACFSSKALIFSDLRILVAIDNRMQGVVQAVAEYVAEPLPGVRVGVFIFQMVDCLFRGVGDKKPAEVLQLKQKIPRDRKLRREEDHIALF